LAEGQFLRPGASPPEVRPAAFGLSLIVVSITLGVDVLLALASARNSISFDEPGKDNLDIGQHGEQAGNPVCEPGARLSD
jgi:hypothetical protein